MKKQKTKTKKEEARAEAGNPLIQHQIPVEAYSWRYWLQTMLAFKSQAASAVNLRFFRSLNLTLNKDIQNNKDSNLKCKPS